MQSFTRLFFLVLGLTFIGCGQTSHAPTVTGLSLTTTEDTAVTGPLEVADADGDELTISLEQPLHGSASLSGETLTYTPNEDFNGSDSFTIKVSDGTHESTATVSLTITAVNDLPIGVGESFALEEDTTHTVQVSVLLVNDSDVDKDSLAISAVGSATHGTVALSGTEVIFTPEADYTGSAQYAYTLTDGTASVEVTVNLTIGGVNDPPVAVDDARSTNEDVALTLSGAALTSNDLDVDGQTLLVSEVSNASSGTVVLAGGVITFTPSPNFFGTATFDYTVTDGAASDTATVTVTVVSVDDPPIAVADSASTAEDTPIILSTATLLANDSDVEGAALIFMGASAAVGGSLSVSAGDVTFTPSPNFTGTGTFRYTVSDGALSSTGTVTITITPVNDPPIAVGDTASTGEDTPLTFTSAALLLNDLDVDGNTLSISSVGAATNGTVYLDPVSGEITFTPAPNFNGTASFEYTVTDGSLVATGVVTVSVAPINDPPIATDDFASTDEDTALVLTRATLTSNDFDADTGTTLTVTGVGSAQNGTASLLGGNVTFTPAPDFSGTASFEYTVSDGSATDTALVTINVVALNDPPVAADDAAKVFAGQAFAIDVSTLLANDLDVDGPSALTLTAVQSPVNGTVALNGSTITFTGTAAGPASFEYEISDGGGGLDVGSVIINVVDGLACGDGYIRGSEECDDDNTLSGDGCDGTTCLVELGYTCAGEPSVCATTCGDGIPVGAEACDDANADELDGCTTQCVTGVVCNATTVPGADRFAVNPLTGACYTSFDGEQSTFADAQAACVALNGHLATIVNAAEDLTVSSVRNPSENPWIGAMDDLITNDARFAWVTMEDFSYSRFSSLEPDDDVGIGGNGDCLHFDTNGEWADTNCTFNGYVTGRICELEVQPCGDGVLHAGEACDDGNRSNGDGCSAICEQETVFISEYVEGSGYNKALELRNPSAKDSFDLAANGCQLRGYMNGSTTATASFALTGTIAPSGVITICNPSATMDMLTKCRKFSSTTFMGFNGNDAIELLCGGVTLDVIGQIGNDPGTRWGSGSTSTLDTTLRRKCVHRNGDANGADAFDPATEWVGFPIDTFSGLNVAECVP